MEADTSVGESLQPIGSGPAGSDGLHRTASAGCLLLAPRQPGKLAADQPAHCAWGSQLVFSWEVGVFLLVGVFVAWGWPCLGFLTGAQKESQALCRSPYVDTCPTLLWGSFEHLSVRKCFWVRESSGSGSGDGPEGKFQDRVLVTPHSRFPLPWGNQKMERKIGERQPGFSWSLTQICGFSFPRFHQVRYFVGPTRKLVDGKWGTFEVPRLEFAGVEGLR